MSQMTPREIVHELNQHIIGQEDAKRAVAIALRNRWRRAQLDEDMRNEVTPKNILMIGHRGRQNRSCETISASSKRTFRKNRGN